MKSIAMICLLFSGSVLAQCHNQNHIFDIPYAKNSSYFSGQSASKLEDFSQTAPAENGYLLLEFKVNSNKLTAEAQKYDKWLAERRIERIKSYLNKAAYPAPIITRILTASTNVNRSVSVVWCAEETEQSKVLVATKKD